MDPNYIIVGTLRRDFLFPPTGNPLIDVPGGNLLYTATGLGVWDSGVGFVTRVGEDYPHEWLRSFEKLGWDTRGIHVLAEALDLRYFQAWLDFKNVQRANPVAHFARLGLPFPKSLLGYQPPPENEDDLRTTKRESPRPADIPPDYMNAHMVHICPVDYLTTDRMLSTFRKTGVAIRTLDPSAAFMTTTTWNDVCTLFPGLTAFLCSERKLRALFWGRTDDLWQMAEEITSHGCEVVVVRRGVQGQILFSAAARKRWEIPAYPVHLVDLTGAGSSFCGGFMAGYQKTYDPLRAVLHGCISASLTIEGSEVFHPLNALPGLAQARLDSLSSLVRQV